MSKNSIDRSDFGRAIEQRPEFNAIHLAAVLHERNLKTLENLTAYQVALDAGKLFGLGKQLAALAVASCNTGLSDRQKKRRETLAAQATEIASWYGLKAECYGDPRGYTLRLTGDGIAKTGWGDGFGVA